MKQRDRGGRQRDRDTERERDTDRERDTQRERDRLRITDSGSAGMTQFDLLSHECVRGGSTAVGGETHTHTHTHLTHSGCNMKDIFSASPRYTARPPGG